MRITVKKTGSILIPGAPDHRVASYEFCCREMAMAISNDARNAVGSGLSVAHPVNDVGMGILIAGCATGIRYCPWCGKEIRNHLQEKE